jgi:proteasome beta subunit
MGKDEYSVKTGTTTVGVVCKDGVVLGADRRATAGYLIADKRANKIHKINDNMALTIAGTVSDAQLLVKVIRSELKLMELQMGRTPSLKESANLLATIVYHNIRNFSAVPGITHFLIAGKDESGFSLYDLYPDGSLTEVKDFIASGSGSVMAFGVLETLYEKDSDTEKGVDLIKKSLKAAMERDIATGNGVQIVAITSKGIETKLDKEIKVSI